MTSVRIGCVEYLNTLPLVEGLAGWKQAQLRFAPPAELIGMLLRGEVDVAIASVIDAAPPSPPAPHSPLAPHSAGEPSPVTLLPDGAIGCDGPTGTVRVFSRVPIERIRRVAADVESHTSVVLLRIVMRLMHGVDVETTPRRFAADRPAACATDPRGGGAGQCSASFPPPALVPSPGPDAILLIGDKVELSPPPADGSLPYTHQLDLGMAWKQLTGLPFVYAVWMCRRGEESSPAVTLARAALDRQRRHNATRLGWIANTRGPQRGWAAARAHDYLASTLRYSVGPEQRAAVARFLEEACKIGAIASPDVHWCDESSALIP